MKILELRAENFKRLSLVELRPDGNMVVLTGANEQGKSSVLDAIMATIAGGRGMKDIPEPIKRGEDRAEVELDLGDLRIRRVWKQGKPPTIEVTNADGMKYSTPQSILDALTGSLTFDPLEFARMQPRDQRATLLRLVELPFDIDENDRQRTALVQAETSARQDVKRAEQEVVIMPAVPADTPDEETPAADIAKELQTRHEAVAANDAKRRELDAHIKRCADGAEYVEGAASKIKALEIELQEAREKHLTYQNRLVAVEAEKDKLAAEVAGLVDPDMSELEEKLERLDELNRSVRQKKSNAESRDKLKAARLAAESAKSEVALHDKARAAALAAAKFPVEGLGFSEDGVTLGGLPFAQASESQRIKTSVAMGMAMNPRLRVMLVRDGSALDSKRMEELAELAKENDWQLWVEKVDETGTVGLVIEDGMVRNAPEIPA